MSEGAFVTVALRKSPIGYNKDQKITLKTMGLTKMNKTRSFKDTPNIRGMIRKVSHLVEVIEEAG